MAGRQMIVSGPTLQPQAARTDGVAFTTYDGRAIDMTLISRAEYVDEDRGKWQGLAIGGVTLGLTGLVGGFISGDDGPCNEAKWSCSVSTAGEKGLIYGGLGAITGAVIGYFLGGSMGARDVFTF